MARYSGKPTLREPATPHELFFKEIRQLPNVHSGRLCCKAIFSIQAQNINSRSRAIEQHRFKNTLAPIRLLQISIPQHPVGDFCNAIT
jgi:hypothetical protein